ncbi:MAG: hypothetical protein FWE80_02540 [Oscillospiraceae bacterium]|nr:hypothetical protein [Oscillospiraceae bacterium]
MKKKGNTITFIVVVAAVAAALTTAAIFLLRWHSRRRFGEYDDVYDDDFNDCECCGDIADPEEAAEEDQ